MARIRIERESLDTSSSWLLLLLQLLQVDALRSLPLLQDEGCSIKRCNIKLSRTMWRVEFACRWYLKQQLGLVTTLSRRLHAPHRGKRGVLLWLWLRRGQTGSSMEALGEKTKWLFFFFHRQTAQAMEVDQFLSHLPCYPVPSLYKQGSTSSAKALSMHHRLVLLTLGGKLG